MPLVKREVIYLMYWQAYHWPVMYPDFVERYVLFRIHHG